MEFYKTGGPAHGIVTKTVLKTLPVVVGVKGVVGRIIRDYIGGTLKDCRV